MQKIERTNDAAFFNWLCNLPEVRPGLAPMELGALDMTAVVTNPSNYALRTEHGGFILLPHGAGFYSVHTQFAAEGRGRHAIAAMRAGLNFMFTRTDCMRIFSLCPDDNPATIALAQAGGARPWFRRTDPLLGEGQVVAWDIFDWAVNEADLEADGKAFHDVTEAAGFTEHPEDATHDRVVGACVRMVRAGQVKKAVLTYNLWAAAAGYPPISFISDNPPLIDVGEGMLMTMTQAGEMQLVPPPEGVS